MEMYKVLSKKYLSSNIVSMDILAPRVAKKAMPGQFLIVKMDEFADMEELKKQHFVFIAGGVGAAPIHPQIKWFAQHGINMDVILGSRSKDLLILEEEFKKLTPNVHVCTDDGSYGMHGP